MKVAHIVFGFEHGGIETMLVNIANEQVKQNISVSIVVINNMIAVDLKSRLDARVSFFCLDRKRGSKNPIFLFKLNVLLNKGQYDVIHIHYAQIYKYLLPKFRSKLVGTIHNTSSLNDYPDSVKSIKYLVSVSKTVQKDLFDTKGVESELIYNGIDLRMFRQKNKDDLSSRFKILIVGRLIHYCKGQDVLLKAISILKNKNVDNISLDIIGDGDSLSYLQELTSSLGVEENVNFLFAKSQEYIFQHLADYELLVVPSFFESFGLTTIEGMAAKIPVLCSDISATKELSDNGKYVTLFKKGDSVDCADKIEAIIHNYPSAEYLAASYEYAKSRFDISITVDNYIKLYNRILSFHRRDSVTPK
ncbi:glycosyltransferase family 4 protein [Bacteroidales bacterium OttesenSCG-928-M11]|nr:glycosyltransferase family 4 protein [Bacteroidales bacterium OttesenSCG-928-M11]